MKKMKKYNKSEIMKGAWNLYRKTQKWVEKFRLSFSECLKRSWKAAKEAAKAAEIMAQKYFHIEINGSRVLINIGDGIVSGNTYRCKETLKQYGLKFNGTEKYWEGNRTSIEELVRNYA